MKTKGAAFPIIISALLGGIIMTSCGKEDNPGQKEVVTISSLNVSNQKTTYNIGDEFVKPTVTVTYSDGTSKDVTESAKFFGFDSKQSGKQKITVSYTENNKTVSTSYEISISVRVLVLSSIKVDSSTKSVYEYGEEFVNPVINAYYNDDDSTKTDVSSKVKLTHEFNSKLSGDYNVNVEYSEGSVTKNVSYKATVNPPTNLIQKIEFSGTIKTEYNVGDQLEKPTVIATFSDESTLNVTEDAVFTYNFDTAGPTTVTAKYTQDRITVDASYDVNVIGVESKLKFAIFADVQLCNDSVIDGKATANFGDTANAPLALEQHLKYIKSQDIDVVLMNGDITNQANEYYYAYFNSIVEKVYGSDKTKWPEFVYGMGNHEWWAGITEEDPRTGTAGNYSLPEGKINAVQLFNENARIDSDNLVKRSTQKYAENVSDTLPSYYKVINGTPFLVISGVNANGIITDSLETEIKGWINEIEQLDSVKAGGPIFVEYHYPLSFSMTHGQGSIESTAKFESLFEDIPNAIVFTGDTHFPGNNERSINQKDFTTINIGSSSYSRMVDESAVICSDYENVTGGIKTSKGDKPQGNVGFDNAYTPNIQIVEILSNNTTKIDRFMTNNDGSARKVGETWTIPATKSVSDFKYTDARFQDKNAAKALYGKEGVSWEAEDKVEFGVNKNAHQMTVQFKDPIEYHYVEHYQIKVNDVVHDFVSDYYKYPEQREDNYYVIDNLPESETYNVEVTAYDFFDNPSLNKLSAEEATDEKSIDPIDLYFADQNFNYSDIESRNNFEYTSKNSNSSSEFHYRGIQNYQYGAILGRLYDRNDYKINDYISLKSGTGSKPTVTIDVKNLSNDDLVFGLSVIEWKNGSEKWHTDFDAKYQKTVTGQDWTTLTWNLNELFELSSRESLSRIVVKAKSKGATSDGYDMNFLLDNIDITNGGDTPTPPPTPGTRGEEFKSGEGITCTLPKAVALTDKVTIDLKLDTSNKTGKANISLLNNKDWLNYFGYYAFFSNGTMASEYPGVSIKKLEDGFFRITFDLPSLVKKDAEDLPTEEIDTVYVRGDWTDIDGRIDVTAPGDIGVIRGEIFDGSSGFTKDLDKQYSLTETITIDFKFDVVSTENKAAIMLGQGWNQYFGYYDIYSNGTLGSKYEGVSIGVVDDGYFRVTFDLSKLNKLADKPAPDSYIDLIYLRPGWTVGSGYIDINANTGTILRGQKVVFNETNDIYYEKNLSKSYNVATDSIIMDIKFDNDESSKINIMFCDHTNWDEYFGYFQLTKSTTSSSFDGVTVETLGDGYMKFTFKLSELTKINKDHPAPTSIDHIYTRGIWCKGTAYIDLLTE